MKKKILSVIIGCLSALVLPLMVFADETSNYGLYENKDSSSELHEDGDGSATIVDSGAYGTYSVNWTLYSDGTLVVSGTGEMGDSIYGISHLYKGCNKVKIENGVTSIRNSAFSNCTSLTSIEIPNSVTSIGDHAFAECTSLTSIEIPNSVTSIGNYAFVECTSLTSIEIPNSVTSIGDSAFAVCTSLTNIEIPNSVTSIGAGAFWNCSSLTNIEIPNSVTSIENNAFGGCESLTNVEIPDSVTSISSFLFCGCTSLTNVEIPNSVTSIGDLVFANCTSLTSIEIPNSFKTIDWRVISGDKGITIYVPESVTYITGTIVERMKIACYDNSYAKKYADNNMINSITPLIEDCTISLSGDTYTYDSLEKKPTVSIEYKGSKYFEKATLEEGKDYTIEYKDNVLPGTASVIIKGIRYTGEKTVNYTINPVSIEKANITLSETEFSYDGTEKKPAVTVKLENKSLIEGKDYSVTYVDNVECGTASVIIKGIGYTGTAVKEYTIKGTSIEDADIKLLASIYTYDGSPKTPPLDVVLGGQTLEQEIDYKVTYEKNVKYGTAYAIVTGIHAYEGAISTTFVILPYSYGMEAVYEDGMFIGENLVYGITDDEKMEVEVCCPLKKGLMEINIPATIKDEGGTQYKVTSVGQKAFYKNTSAKSVSIGNNIKNIENYAFYGCTKLETLKIGKGLEIIGGSSFRKCTKLKSVTLPIKLAEIEKNAFYGCSSLKTINIKSNAVIDFEANAIKGINKKAVIKVPKKLYKEYKKKLNSKTGFTKTMTIKKK